MQRPAVRVVVAAWGTAWLMACGLGGMGGAGSSPDGAPAADSTLPLEAAQPPSGSDAAADASNPADAASNPDATRPPDAPNAMDVVAPRDSAVQADEGPGMDTGRPPREAGPPDAGPILYTCPQGFQQPPTYTTDCATNCSSGSLPCVLCSTSDNSIQAVCVPPGSSCLGTYAMPGYGWCPCNYPDPSSCLIPQQECNPYQNPGICVTCGENSTDTYPCKRGGTCNEQSSQCN